MNLNGVTKENCQGLNDTGMTYFWMQEIIIAPVPLTKSQLDFSIGFWITAKNEVWQTNICDTRFVTKESAVQANVSHHD